LLLSLILVSLSAPAWAGSASAARADGYWTVARGETLYAIARALAPRDREAQRRLRAALLRVNPRAFEGGDPGRLVSGAKLRLPATASTNAPPSVKIAAGTPAAAPAPTPTARSAPRTTAAVVARPPAATQRIAAPAAPSPPARAIPVSAALQRPPAGPRSATLVAVAGRVIALTPDGRRWPLKRGSHVYSGDHIVTASAAHAQLRFTDGGLVSLRSDTEFAIEDYRFDGKIDGKERGFFGLLRGGLRTLSGLIGKIRHKRYRMRTPLATIGIRGTDYALFLCTGGACRAAPDAGGSRAALPDGLWGGVAKGRIVARTEVAEISFSREQFFHVASPRSVPRRVLQPPAVLLQPVRGARKRAPGERKQAGAGTVAKRASESSGDRSAAAKVAKRARVALTPLRSAAQITVPTTRAAAPVRALPSDVLTGRTVADSTRFIAGDQALAKGIAQDASVRRATPGSGVVVRYLARPVNTAAGSDVRPEGGPLVDSGTAANQIFVGQEGLAAKIPKAVVTTDSNPQPGGPLNCQPCTFSSGGATLVDVGGAGGAGLGVNWGRWAGNYFVSENGTRVDTVGSLHFIHSPNLTTPAQLGKLSGVANFNTVLGGTTPIDEQGGRYTLSTGSVKVNFGTQQVIDYNLGLTGTTRNWTAGLQGGPVSFDQALKGGIPLSGGCTGCAAPSVTPATGQASVLFVGPAAERAISGFGLRTDSGAAVTGTMAVAR